MEPLFAWPPDDDALNEDVKPAIYTCLNNHTNFRKQKQDGKRARYDVNKRPVYANVALAKWWKLQGRGQHIQRDKINIKSSNPSTLLKEILKLRAAQMFLKTEINRLKLLTETYFRTRHSLDKTEYQWLYHKFKKQLRFQEKQKRRLKDLSTNAKYKMSHCLPVERRSATYLSVSEFMSTYAINKLPVIITDIVPRMTSEPWTLDHIKQVAGSCAVTLKKPVPGFVEWAQLEDAETVTMTEYIDSLKKQHSLVSDDQRYLFDWSLPIHCPQLASELTIPKYFANDFLQRIPPGSLYHDSWPSLFIAPKGLTSKLHIDAFGSNFWMALFQGRKRWMFFSKDDMQLLYPDYISDYTLDPSFDVDIHQCDREQYPLLQLAEPRECILESGELLFVPAGSPHYVENLDQTIAISANYVDLSNLDLVREELAINGLVCDRAAALWKELSSKEFPITMDGSVTDLAWNEFKQWPKSYDFEALSITPYNMNQSKYTASDIFCHGPLLDVIQQSGIYEDSKTFVDMQMLKSPESVLSDFNEFLKQGQLSRETIQKFVQEHFSGPGDELGAWIPEDWSENPKLLQRLQHPSLKQFVRSLNDLWKSLGRKMLPMDHPERHSLIPVPHPFIIPGDRFREFYYWDTYWIVGGLLAVDMIQTARGMLYNLLHLVDKYGFVPNGGRIYYTNRSQPPLLIPMVDLYFERTGDINFLQQNISVLEKEYYFWIQNRTVNAKGPNGAEHEVAMYNVQACEPRPEAYVADINAVKDLSGEARVRMLSDVASACESGWDFSSRWSGSSNKTVMTCHIVPVDLNVYLCWNEQLLEKFHGIFGKKWSFGGYLMVVGRVSQEVILYSSDIMGEVRGLKSGHTRQVVALSSGNKVKQKMFQGKVTARKHAIDDLFWNDDLGAWFDFNLNGSQAKTDFYPSNVFPLFAGCTNLDIGEPTIAKKVLKYVKRCGVFDYPGGIPTSVLNTGEQWDLPNAWSPLVHLFLESIAKLPLVEAQQLVNLSISNWITSNMSALKNHGYMYEKYDATAFGSPGGGGEYEVQTGFGWSIGVDLMLLETYSSKIEPLLKLNV